jgi:hypothetical protein
MITLWPQKQNKKPTHVFFPTLNIFENERIITLNDFQLKQFLKDEQIFM